MEMAIRSSARAQRHGLGSISASAAAFLTIAVLGACGDSVSAASDVAATDGGGDAGPEGAANCTAPTEALAGLDVYLADRVAKLCGAQDIAPGVRLTDRATPENRRAARTYLNDELASLGLVTSIDDYGGGANVVGRLAATAEGATEWIVVGAHLDSEVGSPGANDNATGVAAVLAVARALREVPCRSRGVMFVMFDQEEVGLLGSKAFAQRERTAATEIVAAHTVDQVGWDADGDRTFEIELPTPALFAEYQGRRRRRREGRRDQNLRDGSPSTPGARVRSGGSHRGVRGRRYVAAHGRHVPDGQGNQPCAGCAPRHVRGRPRARRGVTLRLRRRRAVTCRRGSGTTPSRTARMPSRGRAIR